jgi:hypothetical protein
LKKVINSVKVSMQSQTGHDDTQRNANNVKSFTFRKEIKIKSFAAFWAPLKSNILHLGPTIA